MKMEEEDGRISYDCLGSIYCLSALYIYDLKS